MSDRFFLDTNVLVYAYDPTEKLKRAKARELVLRALHDQTGFVSTQTLSEFFVVVTRKLEEPMAPEAACMVIEDLARLNVVEIDVPMVLHAIDVHMAKGIHYWDALIIASAARVDCAVLYTEDLNSGQEIAGVRIENPFAG